MSNILNLLSEETFAAKMDMQAEKMDMQNALLAAMATQSGGLPISSWSDVQQLVRLGLASKLFSVGDQLVCNRGEETLVWDIIGIDHDTPTDKTKTHSMTLQLHDCVNVSLQYNARGALYYAQTQLAAGTYHITCKGRTDYTADNDKTFQFTLTNAVPAGGQIVVEATQSQTLAGKTVHTYSDAESTSAIETTTLSEGSGGTSLGATDGTADHVNHIQRVVWASNNWKQSAIRQLLNSSAAAGSVWTPQTDFDRPPAWANTQNGFLNGVDADFLDVIGEVEKTTSISTLDGDGSETLAEKIWLPSLPEVYGGKNGGIDEGEPYAYYADHSDLAAPGRGADGNRIKYDNGGTNARYWWLRSAAVSNAGQNFTVYPTGQADTTYPQSNLRIAPACCIV